ncbi:MAG: flagellar biosynthesis anti-sigma factor FlgM [Rubrivivax sp.]
MKIGSLTNTQAVAPATTERKNGNGAAAVDGKRTGSGDTVAISSQASALAQLAGDGSFDAAKVERISRQIKDGSYQVNPETIADKLIANAQELLSRNYR